jgi:D-alanyl-D-alanine carboxypeptidase
MDDTYYQPYDELPPYVVQGYYDLYGNNTIVNVSNLITGSGNGYGGVFSNILAMFTFIDHLLLKKDLITVKSLQIMNTFGKADPLNRYGYGIMMKFIERGIDAGLGHSGRDVGYSANLFYVPNKNVTHTFCVNYGTDADSDLKDVFADFQEELLDLTLQ